MFSAFENNCATLRIFRIVQASVTSTLDARSLPVRIRYRLQKGFPYGRKQSDRHTRAYLCAFCASLYRFGVEGVAILRSDFRLKTRERILPIARGITPSGFADMTESGSPSLTVSLGVPVRRKTNIDSFAFFRREFLHPCCAPTKHPDTAKI